MASIMVLTQSLLVVFICVASYGSCERPSLNGSKIRWNDKFDDKGNEGTGLKTEYDSKGLLPWYNFANFFISIVLNKDPYGRFFLKRMTTLTNFVIGSCS